MIRTRFAPSPTGLLHIGGLRTALYAYLYAKKQGGKFILRIEDTDLDRRVEGAEQAIYRTLNDTGLLYDEKYVQSERKNIYIKYAKQLIKKGGAYYCFCGKDDKKAVDTKYNKKCLSLTAAEIDKKLKEKQPFVIRQNIPTIGTTKYTDLVFGDIEIENKELEDGILIKSDGMPTYNFANVVDDHLMDITVVIRGTEYLSSTPKYNLIYDGLGWERPQYMHLQPIMKDSSQKLSKRHGAASYQDFIDAGFIKEAIINYIALLGWSPKDNREKLSIDEMMQLFSVEGISKSASIFDIEKMRWLNSVYIKEMDDEMFFGLAEQFIEKLDFLKGYDRKVIAKLVKPRISTLGDIAEVMGFLERFLPFDYSLFNNEKQKTTVELAKKMLPEILAEYNKAGSFSEVVEALTQKHGYKKGQVMWIFRIAITNSESTPGGASDMEELLGRDRVIERLKKSIKQQ